MKLLELNEDKNFNDVLAMCIGKIYSNQLELKEYLGNYSRWDVDLDSGKLYLDEKEYDVEFIGTSSNEDDMWFNADLEQIDDKYLQLLYKAYENIDKYGIGNLLPQKIELDDLYTDHAIASIYTAFTDANVCYFKGSGDVSIFAFIKGLPEEIFAPIGANRFFDRVYEMIMDYEVNQKILIKGFALNNENEIDENEDRFIVKFKNGGEIVYTFDENDEMMEADYKAKRSE